MSFLPSFVASIQSGVWLKYCEGAEHRQLPANAMDGSGRLDITIEGIPEKGSKGAIARMVTSLWPGNRKVE